MTPRLALTAALLVLAFGALVALLVPNPGTRAATPVPVSEAAHAAHSGGTGVSAAVDATADEAYLADLFDGQETEVSPQTRTDLIAVGHRICDLPRDRAEWVASLTAGGYTADEAGKILDTATAAYCPAAFTAASA